MLADIARSTSLLRTGAIAALSALSLPLAGGAAVAAPVAAHRAVIDPGLELAGSAPSRVIVTAAAGQTATASRLVRAAGGRVGAALPLVSGFAATVPADRIAELGSQTAITAVTADRQGQTTAAGFNAATTASAFVRTTKAATAWASGNYGAGVGVAVLDTGVSDMNDFGAGSRIVHGPDLSGEGTTIDSYGHGTVMAGVIAGDGTDSATRIGGAHLGMAPAARIVAVKVAGRNGAADVSTMLQAMHWVAAYKDQYNIRVVNLAWGVPSTQNPAVDPINYAVQRLWKSGILVVVAAGNTGDTASRAVLKPADDPTVLTVGAVDDKGTITPTDDAVATWSSRGITPAGVRKPDVVAPGAGIVATRSHGSAIAASYPGALRAPSYIRGSGTSHAASVTSGAAALLLAARPALTPDQVKKVLMGTATPVTASPLLAQGRGRIDVASALLAPAGPAYRQPASGTGRGSIEASRGGVHVVADCAGTSTLITGEIDVRCEPWDAAAWTGSSWTGSSWTGSSWTGSSWTGSSWTGSSWTGGKWTGSSWAGSSWTGKQWAGSSWTGKQWAGSSWSGSSWSGKQWAGKQWAAKQWAAKQWA